MKNMKRILALALVCMLIVPVCASAAGKKVKLRPEGVYRHNMELKRKAEAIDGVTASPYLIDEMYLGYHRLDAWVYNGDGVRMKFHEKLSRNADKSINLSLLVDTTKMDGARVRLDNLVLRTLARVKINTITLCDKNGKPYAEISVPELREMYKSFDLMPYDQIAVGADGEGILKLAEGGKFVPIDF